METINLSINNLAITPNTSAQGQCLNKFNGSGHQNSWKEIISFSKVKSNPQISNKVNLETVTFYQQLQPLVNTRSLWREYFKLRRSPRMGLMESGFLLMDPGNVLLLMIGLLCIITHQFFQGIIIISFGLYLWRRPMLKYLDLMK